MRSSLSTLTTGFLVTIAAPFVAIKAALDRRKLMGHLAGFDDHLLRDIGLTRSDIDAVMGTPYHGDPTLRLALMVRETRSSRQAAAREQLQWAAMADEAERHRTMDSDRRAA